MRRYGHYVYLREVNRNLLNINNLYKNKKRKFKYIFNYRIMLSKFLFGYKKIKKNLVLKKYHDIINNNIYDNHDQSFNYLNIINLKNNCYLTFLITNLRYNSKIYKKKNLYYFN
jgi:hypothetical protein